MNEDLTPVNKSNQEVEDLKKTITENSRVKPALVLKDELLYQIVEGNPVPTFVIDRHHRISHWNKACKNLTGIPANDVIGTQKQWQAFYSIKKPTLADLVVDNMQGKETILDNDNKYRESVIIKGVYEIEDFFPDLGENGKWLFVTAAPLRNAAGDVVGALETLQDFTARKLAEKRFLESEERYRTVLDGSPDPVVVYDMDGKAVYLNPAFERVFGWHPDELLGKKLDYVPEENIPETRMMIDKVLNGENFSGVESRRYTNARTIIDVSISAAIYLNRHGRPAGSVHILRDVTNQKRLEAQVKEGERILRLQKDLEERNKKLCDSNEELRLAYSVIQKDLEAGAKIQASLIPQTASNMYGVQFDFMFLPCTFVAGDIFDFFKLDEHHIGFYVLDVAGHGIPAAMLSVTLSKAISPTNHKECLLKQFMPSPDPPYYRLINPAAAVQALNDRFQADPNTMQYFTMIYGMMNTRDGQTVLTLAGNPLPIYLKKEANATLMGTGGYPVGMLPGIDYDEVQVSMGKGDRLFLYSDGVTECVNNKEEQFSEDRLMRLIEMERGLPLRQLMKKIEQSLREWRGNDDFEDDMTLLAMEIH